MMTNDTYKHPEFPFIPEALVLTLDQTFPLVSPSLNDSERQIFLMAGTATGRGVLEATSR